MKESEHYITTFCNFAHEVRTGRPIGHTCYLLPPTALAAEKAGDFDKANDILHTTTLQATNARRTHRGRRRKDK